MIKKFSYHGRIRELAVTRQTATHLEGIDISYMDSEEKKSAFRQLYQSLDVKDSGLTEDQTSTLKPYFQFFRNFDLKKVS